MSARIEEASKRFYRGVWGILAKWFRVPQEPPSLPARPGEAHESFRPAEGFLRYLKLHFWIVLAIIDGLLAIGWLALLIAVPIAGILTAPLALAVIVLPDIVAYVAIHLRYDTTWYVLSGRSMRLRRGIWVIHETTITFENVQNVTVRQGPLQRWFGIADVLVDTAGGGGSSGGGQHGAQPTASHRGLIEGVTDAQRIRDLILARLRDSRSAGLGDEAAEEHGRTPTRTRTAWSEEHLAVLREIRDAARRLVVGDEA